MHQSAHRKQSDMRIYTLCLGGSVRGIRNCRSVRAAFCTLVVTERNRGLTATGLSYRMTNKVVVPSSSSGPHKANAAKHWTCTTMLGVCAANVNTANDRDTSATVHWSGSIQHESRRYDYSGAYGEISEQYTSFLSVFAIWKCCYSSSRGC